MKKTTFLSLIAFTLLLTGCGEETQKAAAEVNTTKIAKAVKKDTINAMDAAKIKITEAAEAAKVAAAQIAAEAKVEAEKLADAAAEKVASEDKATEAVKEKAGGVMAAPAAYAKCKGCHGAEGKTKALGKSAVIAGQDKETLVTSLKAYQAGTKNVAGMGSLMKSQVETMSDEEIEAVAEYLSQVQ